MRQKSQFSSLFLVLLVYLGWILIGELTPLLNQVFDFRKINEWILPAIHMTLMLLLTMLYTKFFERESFAKAFNFSFHKAGRSLLWALTFFVLAMGVLAAYAYLIVGPLTKAPVVASGAVAHETLRPFRERLLEYLYVVYEGIIEVLIFIGFLLDRLARKWGWTWAVIVSNLGFALWHYNYLRNGWLTGGLMMLLTFLAGIVISLSYVKTRNSLSPLICHTLVDSPSELGALLGMSVMS